MKTPGPWIVNGKTAGGWRIDSVSEDGPAGLEMLMNPVAIVPKKENADYIAGVPELVEEMAVALEAMVKAYNQLMPGIGGLALQDYANINEAPILAQRVLAKVGRP